MDATTVLETEEPLLHLPLNDLPETVLFSNNANHPDSIFCLDETCPTSGVNGADGTAAPLTAPTTCCAISTPLDLPESGLTTALWFKTDLRRLRPLQHQSRACSPPSRDTTAISS